MTDLLKPAVEAITEDDEFLARALECASIPTLMMSMMHITGDAGLMDGPIKPGASMMGEVQGFMSDPDKAAVRQQALAILKDYRDRGCTLPDPPTPDTVHRMMNFMVGEEVSADYVPMMLEELALDGVDARDVALSEDLSVDRKRSLHVVVIGAGMSGLLAAIRLQAAGIAYTVIEKNAGIGGTWWENTYPGCRVDIANHFYCYSFEPNHNWSQYYSEQRELAAYFRACAERYGVTGNIRFNTEVVVARFDESAARWVVETRDSAGRSTMLEADIVVSAVGQLNRPKIPDFPGLSAFAGPKFHCAAWRHDVDLRGKRVAVVGTGASAFQLVPEVAKVADRLYVFQRSAPWMFPNEKYHASVPDAVKWLLRHVPYYSRWYRFLLFWPASDGLLPTLVVDPQWPHQDRSINEANDVMRQIFTDWIASQVGDDPALLDKVVPKYPPFVKRMLQDNGSWLGALKRDNAELVTEAIESVTPTGIRTVDGREREIDVIVFATGFHANKFLWPMEIQGRGGVNLRELWADDPRAYLGITVPKFPNLFCLYGPGTNLAHAGSIIFHSECQVRYVMGCIDALLARGARAMDCKQSVHDQFNAKLDATLDKMVWSLPATGSWYKNRRGRVTTTSPWRLLDYWRWTKQPDLGDYELL